MNQREIDAVMAQYREPAIMLHRPYPPGNYVELPSHLGGLPALPPGIEWPRTGRGLPLHFLAQLDCADLPPTDGVLPDHGMLFFFARIDEEMSWGQGDPRDDCRVIFAPVAGDSPAPAPDDLPAIQSGGSDYQRDFLLPGEPPFTVYPRWPIVSQPIDSWPDHAAVPGFMKKDLTGYQDAVMRARAAETVRVTGLPMATGTEPHWAKVSFTAEAGMYLTLPRRQKEPFPQVWVMVDRIARFRANWARNTLERELKNPPGRASHLDAEQLRNVQDVAEKWIKVAAACGLDEKPEEDERQLFEEWLTTQAGGKFGSIYPGIGEAIKAGMISAIQYAAGSAKTSALVPPAYFHELEDLHLPTWMEKSFRSDTWRSWRVSSKHHQMLGNARSTQQARPVERDDVLLLQLISDYGVNFMFCDVGEMEFWINKDDLAARRFDNVSATTCGG